MNKKVLADLESKNLEGLNKLLYLLDNYNCFIDYNSLVYSSISSLLNVQDVEELLSLDLTKEVKEDIQKRYESMIADTFVTVEPPSQLVTFVLDKRCNKNCRYCSITKNSIPEDQLYDNFDKALTRLEQITNNKLYIQIMGGEPTVWSDWLTDKVINRLSDYRDVYVFTNGSHKDSKLYDCPNMVFFTHITDWREHDYDDYERLPNELFNIVYEHRCLEELERFVQTIPQDELGLFAIMPCFGDSEDACDEQDLQDLYALSLKYQMNNRYSGIYAEREKIGIEKFQDTCNKGRGIWQIDCNTNQISPCCACRDTYNIEDFTGTEKNTNCEGCVNFGNVMY